MNTQICSGSSMHGPWIVTINDLAPRSVATSSRTNAAPSKFVHGSGGLHSWTLVLKVCACMCLPNYSTDPIPIWRVPNKRMREKDWHKPPAGHACPVRAGSGMRAHLRMSICGKHTALVLHRSTALGVCMSVPMGSSEC